MPKVDKRKYLTDICRKLDRPELQAVIDGMPEAELNTAIPYVITAIADNMGQEAQLMDRLGMVKEAAQTRHDAAQAMKNGIKR